MTYSSSLYYILLCVNIYIFCMLCLVFCYSLLRNIIVYYRSIKSYIKGNLLCNISYYSNKSECEPVLKAVKTNSFELIE